MDYLARESAPFSPDFWKNIDNTAVDTLKKYLVCRRFLNEFVPLGAGPTTVNIDETGKTEILEKGIGRFSGRRQAELPLLYEDFTILWRDIEEAEKSGMPLDMAAVRTAARKAAQKEDQLILFGNETLKTSGLMNAKGAYKIKKSNWKEGENAFTDVSKGIAHLIEQGLLGRMALVVSPDVYLDMQRLQLSVGMLEIDRISKLTNGHIYTFGPFGTGKAVLVCAEPEYMDLAVGIDFSAGYLELQNFNHNLRLMESAALRIKNPEAVVVFE